MKKIAPLPAYLLLLIFLCSELFSCTRLLYEGPYKTVLTARSMDFSMDIPANLWILPRGMKRSGQVGVNSLTWHSRYGSVVTSAWDIAVPDGMNEKGLVANMLWLVKSEYPQFDENATKKGITISAWAQYALDNFATVKEAVEELKKENFVVVSDVIPGTDKFTTVHLSLSDASGDSAIFEYINEKLIIHHNSAYTVVTNDPTYQEQLAIESYWREVGGSKLLPGSNKSSDRFVRGAYYLNAIAPTNDAYIAMVTLMSILRNVSVSYGITSADEPHIASTRWRVVADHKNLLYYFENVLTPNTIWVDLKKIDFNQTAPVKKLSLEHNEVYNAEVSNSFDETPAFEFKGTE